MHLYFHLLYFFCSDTIGASKQGVSEIYMLYDRLVASYRFRGPSSDWILPLHSSIASTDQKKVFLRPPDNIRKVTFGSQLLSILLLFLIIRRTKYFEIVFLCLSVFCCKITFCKVANFFLFCFL